MNKDKGPFVRWKGRAVRGIPADQLNWQDGEADEPEVIRVVNTARGPAGLKLDRRSNMSANKLLGHE
jgi:hypothetical protein